MVWFSSGQFATSVSITMHNGNPVRLSLDVTASGHVKEKTTAHRLTHPNANVVTIYIVHDVCIYIYDSELHLSYLNGVHSPLYNRLVL